MSANHNTAFPGTVTATSFDGNATSSTVTAKLGRGANTSLPMTFNWAGQSGQPSWLWGGNDGTNMYVYNPSNFRVSYAASAGNADTVDNKHASDFYLKTDTLPTGALRLIETKTCDSYSSATTLTFAGTSTAHDYIAVSAGAASTSTSISNFSTWYITYISRKGGSTTWKKIILGSDGTTRFTFSTDNVPITVTINKGSYAVISLFEVSV